MTVYIAMINDRHSDPEPHLFATAEAAIEYAKTKAAEYVHPEDAVEEEQLGGWLYYARYSQEGDSVWVIAKEISYGEDGREVCPYDCDNCHDGECPCNRLGCAGDGKDK